MDRMGSANGFGAGVLEASATGYGGVAASLLLDGHPDVQERWGREAFRSWKGNLTQRILELAAAMRVEQPRLFVSRVLWSRRALVARDLPAQDLATSLECLREVLSEQLPASAATIAEKYLDEALAALSDGEPAPEDGLEPDSDEHRLALEFLATVLEGRPREAIELVVGRVESGLDLEKAFLEVLLPAQREIGRLWHEGSASVAEEHLVTGTTERALSLLTARADRAKPNGGKVLLAAVQGNVHEVGIRILADLLEIDGWNVIYLGADVPNVDLIGAAAGYEVDLVVLSGALTTQVGALENALRGVKGLEEPPAVLVGGAAFDAAPELGERIGADAYSPNLREAVAWARRFVG